jgi:hypothetical protein
MVNDNPRRALILMVTVIMLIPGLSMALPGGDDIADGNTPGPVDAGTRGDGEGMEPISVTLDRYEDRFNAILPWPTNRTFYSLKWRPEGDYALAVGSGGSLYKVVGNEITRIETGTSEALYDVAWTSDGSEAIIVGNHSALFTWDAAAEDLTQIELTIDQRFLGAAWDPTDTYAMIVGNSGFLGRWNGTGVMSIPTGFADFLYRIVWRPGGDYALAVGDSGLLLKVNTTDIVNTTRLDFNWGLWRLDWAASGDYALISGKNYAFVTPKALVVRYNATDTFDQIPVPGDPTAGLRGVDFDFTGEKAIIVGENSTVLQWDGGVLTSVVTPEDRTMRGCAWEPATAAPERSFLVVGNRGLVWRNDEASWANISYDPKKYNYAIAWRPQGDYGLVVGEGGFMAKVSPSGGMDIDSGVSRDLFDVDWSSDGTYALACGGGGTVLRYNHGASAASTIRTGVAALHGISIKPGTNEALAVGDQGHVWHFSMGIWTDKPALGDQRNLRDVAWRPDAKFAIIVGVSGAVLNFTGTGLATSFTPQPLTFAPFFSVAWNKDGTQAMAVGGQDPTSSLDTIWVYDNNDWLQVDSSEDVPFYGCAFTADGQVGVAFGAPDVIVKFSTAVGEGFRSTFQSPYTWISRGCMHPTGRAVYFAGSNGYAYRMDVSEFPNSPPVVAIASPGTGSKHDLGEMVELSANGSWDADGDELTYTWISNVSGHLASGSVAHVAFDDVGWHHIDLFVDDGKGHNVTDFVIIKIEVPNYPPVAVINSPAEGSTFTNEDVIVFDGNGSYDPNGEAITYQWVSDLSGDLGYEERIESVLRVGEHKIVLWVEDELGLRSSETVNITVVQANRPPIVYITSPEAGDRFDPEEVIELNASYSFDPDGDPLTFVWTDDVSGDLGSGAILMVTLSVGHHMITVTVDDGEYTVASDVNITVEEPPNLPPEITLTSPPSNSTLKGTVTVTGLASDPEGEPVTVTYAFRTRDEWYNATMEGSTWSFIWDTTADLNGQYSVFVKADDGVNTNEIWTQYFVDNLPVENTPPTVDLVSPEEGTVKGGVRLEGLAFDADGDTIERVEVRFDSGLWQMATGGNAWFFEWDTDKTPNGPVVVSIRAYDGQDYSDIEQYNFSVNNPDTDPAPGISLVVWVMAIMVIVIVVVAVGVWYMRR